MYVCVFQSENTPLSINYLIKISSTLANTAMISSLVANLSEGLELALSFCQMFANNLADTTVSEPADISGAKYISLTPFPCK